MTELAELLLSLDDNVFTVKFKTKPNEEAVQNEIESLNENVLKNEA